MEKDKRPITAAQRKAVSKYKQKAYDQIQVRLPKGERDIVAAHAQQQGMSMNEFVKAAIHEKMERDKKGEG